MFHGDGDKFFVEDSSVSITTPNGTRGSISCVVHTDPTLFLDHIPDDECLIAPIVDCQLSEDSQTPSGWFVLSVPHCQNIDPKQVTVRHGDIYGKPSQAFQRSIHLTGSAAVSEKASFFQMNDTEIIIYTKKFSQFICTSCKLVCYGQGQAFIFGKKIEKVDAGLVTSLRLYTCSPLYIIEDYREVTIQMQLQTHCVSSSFEQVVCRLCAKYVFFPNTTLDQLYMYLFAEIETK